jgi:hypothetical protein
MEQTFCGNDYRSFSLEIKRYMLKIFSFYGEGLLQRSLVPKLEDDLLSVVHDYLLYLLTYLVIYLLTYLLTELSPS